MPPLDPVIDAGAGLPGLRPAGPGGGAHGPDGPPPSGWRARWLAWRDARLGSADWRRRAATWLPARPVARRRAARLFDLMSGFVYSQVLSACVELQLFAAMADGPRPLQVLAERAGLSPDAMRRLLDAAVSLDLLEHRGGGWYGLGVLGAPMVEDEAIAAMVRHHAVLYADLRDPLRLLRAGSGDRVGADAPDAAPGGAGMARYWPYADGQEPGRLDEDQVAEYSALMSASQPLVAQEVLAAVPLTRFRHLLDIGGGEGRFLEQVAAAAPALQLTLFDLPAVARRAARRFEQSGLAARARAVGGDFQRDPLPEGADLVSLVRVLFDHPDARCAALLARVHAVLPRGGSVLIAEPMSGAGGSRRFGDAYYGFYLLAMGRGRARSADDHARLLRAAGFVDIQTLATPMPLQSGVVMARKA